MYLLIVLGLLLGLYLYYYAFFKAEDDSETVAVVVLASVSFGFALLGLRGNTNYYRQDIDYSLHVRFLEKCLSLAKEKYEEDKEEYDDDSE